MSQTENHIGTLKRLPRTCSSEEMAKEFCKTRKIRNEHEETWLTVLQEQCEDIAFFNGRFYYIDDIETDDVDVFHAVKHKNGDIDYILNYYNGGCSFQEALEKALGRLDKKENSK